MKKGFDSRAWRGTLPSTYSYFEFYIGKITEGTGFVNTNPGWRLQLDWGKDIGLSVGGWHWWLGRYDPVAQAKHYRDTVGDYWMDFPPIVDIEDTFAPKAPGLADHIYTHLQQVEAEFGEKPLLYSAKWWWDQWITPFGTPAWMTDYDWWIAHWSSSAFPVLPTGLNDWVGRQYIGDWAAPGWGGLKIDVNKFKDAWYEDNVAAPFQPPNGDLEKLRQRIYNIEAWIKGFQS